MHYTIAKNMQANVVAWSARLPYAQSNQFLLG